MKCSKCGKAGAWVVSSLSPDGKKVITALCYDCYHQKQYDLNSGHIEDIKKFIDDEIEEIKKNYTFQGGDIPPGLQSLMDSVVKDIQDAMVGLSLTPDSIKGLLPGESCPKCGMSWEEFKANSKFGCGECYEAFSDKANKIVKHLQCGATKHIGKVPSNLSPLEIESPQISNSHLIEVLEKRLQEVIEKEDYEKAALFRDKLKALKGLNERS